MDSLCVELLEINAERSIHTYIMVCAYFVVNNFFSNFEQGKFVKVLLSVNSCNEEVFDTEHDGISSVAFTYGDDTWKV